MIFIDKYINICYICISYLFMIHKANIAHEQRGGASGCIPGVSSFLFCSVIGGVERGESTGSGADDRSIRERYTALFVHVLRGERNRGHDQGTAKPLE